MSVNSTALSLLMLAGALFAAFRLLRRNSRDPASGRQWIKSSSKSSYHPQDRSEVYHVAFLLRQVTVTDLVPAILDAAGYWTKQTSFRDDHVEVRERDAGYIYLSTQPIESPLRRSVKRIVIATQSHDQGWSSYHHDRGTYRNSWTWLCVSKISAGDFTQPRLKVTEDESPLIRIVTNKHAQKESVTHIVDWPNGCRDEESWDFFKNLKHDDIILISVWARYQGWMNAVQSVRAEIFTAWIH